MSYDEEIESLHRQRVRLKGNLHGLYERRALYGPLDTPTSLRNEIALTEEEIERIESQLRAVEAQRPAQPSLTSPTPAAPNPFGHTGRISDPAHFFGRDELMRQIFEELGKGCNRALLGASQVGKSSLLAMVCRLGPQRLGLPASSFVYLDMQLIHDEQDFFEALCDHLEIATCRGFRLGRALRGRRIVLCLDEIEKMTKDRFTGDEREELRGLADGSDAPIKLLVASRVPLDQLFPDAPGKTSPLANICPSLDVPPFRPEVVRAFIEHRLHGTGITFTSEQIDEIVRESGGIPARVQWLAAELYHRALRN